MKLQEIGAFAVNLQAKIQVPFVARLGIQRFENVGVHGVVLCELNILLPGISLHRAIHGALYRLVHIHVSGGLGIG